MRRIKERTNRHDQDLNMEHLYSNDVSALKKLRLQEAHQERIKEMQANPNLKSKEENFAGRANQRKVMKKPTASEQRNL